jgi:hypothetical protein
VRESAQVRTVLYQERCGLTTNIYQVKNKNVSSIFPTLEQRWNSARAGPGEGGGLSTKFRTSSGLHACMSVFDAMSTAAEGGGAKRPGAERGKQGVLTQKTRECIAGHIFPCVPYSIFSETHGGGTKRSIYSHTKRYPKCNSSTKARSHARLPWRRIECMLPRRPKHIKWKLYKARFPDLSRVHVVRH